MKEIPSNGTDDSRASSRRGSSPQLANGGSNGVTGHHPADRDADSDSELTDPPVSMTLQSLAPFSSISEVTLNKLDLGDLQLKSEEFDV